METQPWRASLPNETWHAIFALLPPPALLAAALVSHQWHALAARTLYAAIAIADSPLLPAPHKAARLAAALAARPHLAAYPRRLSFRTHAHGAADALAAILPLLRDLDALELSTAPGRLDPALLAGVRSLALTSAPRARELAALAAGKRPLAELDLGGVSVTPVLLRDVSRALTRVRVLRVRLALRHTLHFALSGIALLAALTPVLGAFPLLIELDLSPTDVVGRAQPAEEHSLCATYARACPALARVVFPSKMEWLFLSKEEIWVSKYL
ncbi:hypothetical protein GLOTRDRAFT_121077 [Gloeophyllum trabeum ATCC 11539]|uniref:F-box domain-containing protein n=1 Tax=Gloeophyllum trabeum (strain ATCC 11539 / FP-39264 / Madison 617) TaxID=670483 RepID=S7QBJ2_GLOTA|nr:uncharacterized protein GLOTRDRAFT_121077 [Gloeophyllum trabeum ATCC 11539]EPQ56727.1 hypothetical protein GLOTRDRAFT_121077 [Gloeophyllum trabeum ATCC 11539]